MRNRFNFFIFIGAVGMASGIGQWLMYSQGLMFLEQDRTLVFFLLMPLTFVLPNVVEKYLPRAVIKVLALVGGYWLIFCYYSIFLMLIYFLIYLGSMILQQPMFWQNFSGSFAAGAFAVLLLVITLGSWNAFHPVYRKINVITDKHLPRKITIAFASDIHLGAILSNNYSKKLAEKINEVKPDFVIFGGDIIDGNLEFVIKDGSYKNLNNIKAPLGTYAVYGNHDYYGEDIIKEQEMLAPAGIRFLKDQSVVLENSIQITGLDDFLYNPRNKVPQQDNVFFKILVDHEPWRIKEAAAAGYDLYFAGHTHAGQFYPNSIVTKRIYDLDYGSKMFGKMMAVVSNGYGFWGIPVRIGPAPEIVVVCLESK